MAGGRQMCHLKVVDQATIREGSKGGKWLKNAHIQYQRMESED